MTALAGEVGEAANVVKKLNRYRDGVVGNKETYDELHVKLRRELGDVGVYLDLMLQRCGCTLEEAMREVFNSKSGEIGYPKVI
ncbi:MazG-like family protein [Bradyrhizobium betae]|nr:MazG-like family protein [Bradyrhizobium betae]MCS3725476.1 NTP pyrophosphatase (non-canonical NTP hydrolase) [Bradyrhizobium betae]